MKRLNYLVLLLTLLEQPVDQGHGQLVMPPVNIVPSHRACPDIDEILQQIRSNISDVLNEHNVHVALECGDGPWYQVAYLNMTDPSQLCPSAWREYNTSGVRACGRPVSSGENCSATLYTTKQQYSRVCGRVIGYQVGSPDGFLQFHFLDGLNRGYMDGVSITHGDPRHHIWSYAAGATENRTDFTGSNCPCSLAQGTELRISAVGSNYYCESGNPSEIFPHSGIFYQSDPLWDGQQCEGTCCSGTKSPPWFSVQLPTNTADDIEVRICADESTENEDVLVELLEIYVQ